MPRKTVNYQGMKVRLKKGQSSLSTAQKNAIHRMESQMGRRGKTTGGSGCVVVFFGSKAVQRCEGRKLSTSAKRRYQRLRAAGKICRKKTAKAKGKQKLFTNRCGR